MIISQEKQSLIDKHLSLVLEANKIHNLTNISNFEEAKVLHVEDSLAGLEAINKAPLGLMLDMGSGAGYPGIPLAIASGRSTTLIESVAKKAVCLKTFILELELKSHIFVSNQRIEEHASLKRNSYSVITARALSSITSLLELASPLLKIGGHLVAYKGYDINNELEVAIKVQDKLGMRLISNEEYELSNGIMHRIVVFQKEKEADIKLPRKFGLSQKRPIKG